MVQRGLVKPRDSVVMVTGFPVGQPGSANVVRLYKVGEGR
jgi:pyruvate kinase